MKAARAPRANKANVKLLIVNNGGIEDSFIERLADHLRSGDSLVVNDAATLPASLPARDARNNQIELRLTMQLDDRVWQAVVFGAGDWRTPTENRPSPPRFAEGDEMLIAPDFHAKVRGEDRLSERLLNLEFNLSGEELWRNLYRYGNPVQYSYMKDELKLWSVQNIYSGRPWAVEMPSAGHALSWRLLLKLIGKGVRIVPITHGAGLSSTGDEKIDRALPLAERFEIPASAMEAVRAGKAEGGRVIAVGTSVVRALESSGSVLSGFTTLRLGPGYERKIVDGLLTGAHDVSESHYQLMSAFLPQNVLEQVSRHFEREEYLMHEFGDLCLILA
ncbi:MAG TPA: S-adenosylmethionine:tRNA ribosyltransferase-isomerase [Blastocatellia bacterium]|nr:S-adenosylmethionine:tRNA ribosyltransferase-isomerase [Blastocatellia bacterium]